MFLDADLETDNYKKIINYDKKFQMAFIGFVNLYGL